MKNILCQTSTLNILSLISTPLSHSLSRPLKISCISKYISNCMKLNFKKAELQNIENKLNHLVILIH